MSHASNLGKVSRYGQRVDVLQLYRELCAAEAGTEDFEWLDAQWLQVCEADPAAVADALLLEAYTA